VYIDREKVEDFLSALVGGLPSGSSRARKSTSPSVDASLDVKIAGAKRKGGATELSWEQIQSATHASLFESLHQTLLENEMLQCPGERGASWDHLDRGDFMEVECALDLSGLEGLFDFIRRLHRFMSVLSPEQVQDAQWQKVVQYLDFLDQEHDSYNVRLIPVGQPKGWTVVTSLAKRHLRGGKAEIVDRYTVLGRIQRNLQPGTTMELFSLVPEGYRLTTQQLREFLGFFRDMPPQLGKPPTMDDLRVQYPAIIVTAIAVYR